MSDFLQQIRKLRTAHKDGRPAPHKAILLLSILDLIEFGIIKSNRIPFDKDLESAFSYTWKRYLGSSVSFNPDLTMPFWYMQSEPFWTIHSSDGKPLPTTAKKNNKVFNGAFAVLPDDVYAEMQQESFRAASRVSLIGKYLFPPVEIKVFNAEEKQKSPKERTPRLQEKRVWLIPSNSKFFDLASCFRRYYSVYWSQNVNFQAGDIGYIYSAAPYSRIIYKVVIVKSDLRFSPEIQREKEFYKNESDFNKSKENNRYALFALQSTTQSKELELSALMKHGLLSAPQGTMVISNANYRDLLKHIEAIFKAGI